MHLLQYRELVRRALDEDLAQGDKTTDSIFSDEQGKAEIISRENGIIAGLPVAAEVFSQVMDARFIAHFTDGDAIGAGDCVATVEGRVASILKGERVALNFMQRLSGIATQTASAVRLVAGTRARIVDTRKTTPGLRILEKYAVRAGGGENHRFNLGDMVMIKDNHIKGAGSITQAVKKVRKNTGFTVKIEVEAAGLQDVAEALACEVDIIMLDNMTVAEMAQAVSKVRGRALTEASGGITESQLQDVAQTGVDLISLGYLTHSYRSFDLSLKLL
ncbi:MAG: carboxylating nicotinate-nucleotide diphosphorylase [Bacillota bacterium]|nr:carboxylating nicotinate-nucleotide diphosphorylase [Bacillota bacterium]MDW7683402.1 carboxylating nicotinate-nucleotide diphosphorylase [Bacillota bacterium]